jgi:hypothetical protein
MGLPGIAMSQYRIKYLCVLLLVLFALDWRSVAASPQCSIIAKYSVARRFSCVISGA